jgi:hypothetical protein
MLSRPSGGLVVLAISVVFVIALLFVPIGDHVPQQAIHPTVDDLNFRSAIPPKLPDWSTVIRTVKRRETFRVLGEEWGVSEKLLAKKWYLVENTATRERGYVASWYMEPAPVAIFDPNAVEYHPFGREAARRIRSGPAVLAATAWVWAKNGKTFAWEHGQGIGTWVGAITGIIILVVTLRGRSFSTPLGPLPGPPPASPPLAAPSAPAQYSKSRKRHYGQTPSGKPFSIRRNP